MTDKTQDHIVDANKKAREYFDGCPHCGAPAHGYELEAHQHSPALLALIPNLPKDVDSSYVVEGSCDCGSGLIGASKTDVMARWNRRAATQQSAARIAALEAEVSKLTTALFECREAFPIPEPGAPLEPAWMGAMTDPEDVPEYVKAQVLALRKDAGRYRWLQKEHERHDPLCHLSWKQNANRNGSEWVNTANLDSSIDSAIEAERGEG